jgi:CheY-like chemotaxis protein
MKKPIIFTIDDDPQVLRAIERDLRRSYSKDYRVLSAESGPEALESVKQLKSRNETIAMFISDQRMPEMEGVDFLTATKEYYPDAKKDAADCVLGHRRSHKSDKRCSTGLLFDETLGPAGREAVSYSERPAG